MLSNKGRYLDGNSNKTTHAYGISLINQKIRVWLYEETAKIRLSRRVCCLTVTLIDLFFARGGTVEVDSFHSMSLACLLLANKLTDNRTIPIDLNVFPLS